MEKFDVELLTDFLLESNKTLRDIAIIFETDEKTLRQFIKEHKLGWIRKNKGFASRGQAALTSIMHKLLPGEEIKTEEHIGERLRLDVYCPKYKIAAEFHGSQHFEYNGFFHKDYNDFLESQKRDERKTEICKELGITLVVFRYSDRLTEDMVFDRLMEALKDAPPPPDAKPSKYSMKDSEYRAAANRRRREYSREQYLKMKEYKKRDR